MLKSTQELIDQLAMDTIKAQRLRRKFQDREKAHDGIERTEMFYIPTEDNPHSALVSRAYNLTWAMRRRAEHLEVVRRDGLWAEARKAISYAVAMRRAG